MENQTGRLSCRVGLVATIAAIGVLAGVGPKGGGIAASSGPPPWSVAREWNEVMLSAIRLDYARPRTKIPVYIAAISTRSIRQTGEIADGWVAVTDGPIPAAGPVIVPHARLDEALSGRGSLAVVVGEPGIGKSRLIKEMQVQAKQQGSLVLRGDALAYSFKNALAPFQSLFFYKVHRCCPLGLD